ncbi:MAG: acylneuraminate cytidylyltransferase family protein [Flavobacterium sp.]|nr:MAG: acylneuraminate cytidylyltransferase family protein [Flavobacterium sp.]
MTKTIAVIPARGGSKRLPNKNILPLGGLPLLAHSVLYAKANAEIDEVYVSTDSEKIKEVAMMHGAKVIDRPESISGDNEPTITALQHILQEVTADTIVLLQPTNPLRPANLLSECFALYRERNASSLFTVTRNHQKFGKISDGKFIPFNYQPGQRSQDLEPLYFENGLLYICSSETIKKGEIITENSIPFITDDIFSSVDIDTEADFAYAEYLYKTHFQNDSIH